MLIFSIVWRRHCRRWSDGVRLRDNRGINEPMGIISKHCQAINGTVTPKLCEATHRQRPHLCSGCQPLPYVPISELERTRLLLEFAFKEKAKRLLGPVRKITYSECLCGRKYQGSGTKCSHCVSDAYKASTICECGGKKKYRAKICGECFKARRGSCLEWAPKTI